eukprot:scaffold213003_cov31-Tisochrysis_lutea.AAC.8
MSRSGLSTWLRVRSPCAWAMRCRRVKIPSSLLSSLEPKASAFLRMNSMRASAVLLTPYKHVAVGLAFDALLLCGCTC